MRDTKLVVRVPSLLYLLFAFVRKVAFGEVRGKNDALANSFRISSYPRLVFFCGGDAGVSFPYEVRHAFAAWCVRIVPEGGAKDTLVTSGIVMSRVRSLNQVHSFARLLT